MTPSEGKDSDSSDLRKTLFLFFDLFCRKFWSVFFPPSVVVVDFIGTAAAAAKSRQSCPTLCDPIYGSPPGSLVPGILQARILEWVAISFFNASR